MSFCKEEESERKGDACQDRKQVFQARHLDPAGYRRQFGALFAQRAQELPAIGEVAGQEEDDQDPDHFHGLEAEQVHLRVTYAGTGPEENQGSRQRESGDQRYVTQAASEPVIIEHAGRGERHASERDALDEIDEHQGVPERIAEGDHQHQADPAEELNRRQNQGGVAESPNGPEDVHGEEQQKEHRGPHPQSPLVLIEIPDNEGGLQAAHLRRCQQGQGLGSRLSSQALPGAGLQLDEAAGCHHFAHRNADASQVSDIRHGIQVPHVLEDLAGDILALRRQRDGRQIRQQLFALLDSREIQRSRLRDGQPRGSPVPGQHERGDDESGGEGQRDELQRAKPERSSFELRSAAVAIGGCAAGYGHAI